MNCLKRLFTFPFWLFNAFLEQIKKSSSVKENPREDDQSIRYLRAERLHEYEAPKLLKEITNSLSIHNRNSNRRWGILISTALFVMFADISLTRSEETQSEVVNFLKVTISAGEFYPVAAVFLAVLNIGFCTSHLQAMRVQDMLSEVLRKVQASEIGISKWTNPQHPLTLQDVVYFMYEPAQHRMHPVTHFQYDFINNEKRLGRFGKMLADFIYYGFPSCVMSRVTWVAMTQNHPVRYIAENNAYEWGSFLIFLLVFFISLAAVIGSLYLTIVTFGVACRHIWGRRE